MKIQVEVVSILIVTIICSLVFILMGNKVTKLDMSKKPTGVANLAIQFVSSFRNLTMASMGEKFGPGYAPYITVLFSYLALSNMAGLLGISNPTANYSVTLSLALISWILFQRAKIKYTGLMPTIKGMFEPVFLFFIPNFFGLMAPLISMSLRLFGNVLSGRIIGSLLYMFTGWLSSLAPAIGNFNFVAMILAPPIHFYFDVFSALLQAFLFISLTMVFISVELPTNEN